MCDTCMRVEGVLCVCVCLYACVTGVCVTGVCMCNSYVRLCV